MEGFTSPVSAYTLQTLAFTTIFIAVCFLLPKFTYWVQLSKLPALSGSASSQKQQNTYIQSAAKMYKEGYAKFKNSVYHIRTSDGTDNVVVAPRFLPELNKLPNDVLSFSQAVVESIEAKYTGLLTDDEVVAHSVRADLTPGLVRLNAAICDEVNQAVHDEMPECDDWTAVPIYMKIATMVAKISGRVFVGPELCRDEDYVECGVNYTMDVVSVLQAVKTMKPWLRPILAPRLPEVARLREREKMATNILHPVIKSRVEAQANDPNWERPDDMLAWFMSRSEQHSSRSTEYYAKMQLNLIFAAIHTTTLTATNVLYDLAAQREEYIEPLREEIRHVISENGGIFTTRALQQMVKLDSYMKESMRFHPPGYTSFSRKVVKGFTLSNGQYIPAGVTIEVPSAEIYRDPNNYANSDTFDGFRHAKLRENGGATEHARNQFVTTNEQNLMFGYGRHACPGRFFAANEIKMILARLLLEYDFKNEDGSKVRYPNIELGRTSTPDPRKVLMFKRLAI